MFKLFDAFPANSSTSAVRFSRMAALYKAAVAPTRPWLVVLDFREPAGCRGEEGAPPFSGHFQPYCQPFGTVLKLRQLSKRQGQAEAQ